MKKFAIFVASLMLLSGCSAVSDTVKTEEKPETNTEQDMPEENDGQGKTEETASEMYIEQAQLNEDEKNILSLMDVKNNGVICDFAVDENVESVHITVYKYKDGEWKHHSRASTTRAVTSFTLLLKMYTAQDVCRQRLIQEHQLNTMRKYL